MATPTSKPKPSKLTKITQKDFMNMINKPSKGQLAKATSPRAKRMAK